ncbi:MAG: hypothetical protein K8S99_12710 [Planctomycetes bacterium]|nr:hypothetical protein [Planctomycetota bacterium]
MPERCANCDTAIGKLETAFVWRDNVVCEACFQKLARQHTAPPLRTRNKMRWIFAGITAGTILIIFSLFAFKGAMLLISFRLDKALVNNSDGGNKGELPVSPPPGKVRFTVTWKYNDFVGNKPDTDAVAVLIPKDLLQKIPGEGVSPGIAGIAIDETKKRLAAYGTYIAIIGGDGKATISGVKPGPYSVVILSKNTHELRESPNWDETRLKQFFTSSDFAAMSKVHFTEVDAPSGDEIEVSYDFGLTYF